MTTTEQLGQEWWQVAFRISHAATRIGNTLFHAQALQSLRPIARDKEENLTDLVLCLAGDSKAVLGRAVVALWDAFEEESIPCPVVTNVCMFGGGAISVNCTEQYDKLLRMHYELMNVTVCSFET